MQASFVNKIYIFSICYIKIPRLSQRDFRGSTTKSKQDSNVIVNHYPLQNITAGRAVNKREQLVTPGAQDALHVFKPGGSPCRW